MCLDDLLLDLPVGSLADSYHWSFFDHKIIVCFDHKIIVCFGQSQDHCSGAPCNSTRLSLFLVKLKLFSKLRHQNNSPVCHTSGRLQFCQFVVTNTFLMNITDKKFTEKAQCGFWIWHPHTVPEGPRQWRNFRVNVPIHLLSIKCLNVFKVKVKEMQKMQCYGFATLRLAAGCWKVCRMFGAWH